ncbi:hypothetical protein [Saccharothrix sp. HUAS TT1]|uniref:hypothetical protein n=1 Tax=unclassified Saccharothrix TaxID=2593673 RepID=UPI00345B73AB
MTTNPAARDRSPAAVARVEGRPATTAPGATRRRVHEVAGWIARNTFRASADGGLHMHGITRTLYRHRPMLLPAHLPPYERAVLGRALGLTGHVLCRDGRIVHRSTVRPPRLAVDGHAYRNRTHRRTRKSRR